VKLNRSFFLAALIVSLGFVSTAQAQATRTWVSGVGDDANPCSRTAPCKTFAGAISKTAANGEISVLDPGGFGSVTITKALVIDGSEQIAGVLAANTNGIIVNAGANDHVILRNLDIHGSGSGFDGIRILSAKSVTIDNCRIQAFTSQGIEILPTVNPVKVYIRDTQIRNNSSHGILVLPTAPATVQLTIAESQIVSNGSNGIDVAANNNTLNVFNSVINGNGVAGVVVEQTSSTAFIESSILSYNATGVFSGTGVNTPVIRLSRTMVTGNTSNGIAGSGTVVGFQNNTIVGNTGSNSVSSSTAQQ
jgi:hypothetical protein